MLVRFSSSPTKPPIMFPFQKRKAVAAAAVLLEHAGGKMRYIRLIKLLYLADRESLARRLRPIVGGYYVSMKHGLVTSEILDLIKLGDKILRCGGKLLSDGTWSRAIEKTEYEVKIVGRFDLGPLSQEEIGILREVADRYSSLSIWQLRDLTHKLKEWQNPGGGSIPVDPESILKALRIDKDEIEKIRKDTVENEHFFTVFGC